MFAMPKIRKPPSKKQRKELPMLRQKIEEDACIKPVNPESRIALWEHIRGWLEAEYKRRNTPPQNRKMISDKILERMWGFEKYEGGHDPATYDALALVAGYEDWKDFIQSLPKEQKKTPVFFPDAVESSRLEEGEKVTIGWHGIYYIRACYLGDDRFEVLQSKGTRYKRGDIFRAKWFSVTYVRALGKHGEGYLYAPRIWLHLDGKPEDGSDAEDTYYYDLTIEAD